MNIETDVLLAQKGGKEAFSRLVKAHELDLYRIARSIVRRDEDCADAIQETILKAYNSIPRLKKPQFFKTWFMRILINECNQILRTRKRTSPVAVIPHEQRASEDYGQVDLRDAVDRLEAALRVVVRLHYFEDMSIGVIAELLDVPEGTIKSRLHRARLLLADWLGNSDERKIGYEPCSCGKRA